MGGIPEYSRFRFSFRKHAVQGCDGNVEVGQGAVIRRAEISIPDCNVTPRWLSDLAVQTAEEEGIPYQVDILSFSFSDASAINISAGGIPTIAILVPRRNSHSPAEVASVRDIDHAIKLTTSVVEKLGSLGPSLLKQD